MLNDINDVYNFCGFIANKQSSFEITPDEFNICINVAQQQYFKTKLGFPEEYSVEKREARQEFQTTQSNSDSLRPFIVTKSLIKNGDGFDIPADFACFAGNSYLFVEQIGGVTTPSIQPIEVVTIGERGIRLNNYIKYPTYEYPIGTYLNGQLVTNPDDISAVTLTYVRYPKTPIRNYDVVNDFNTYQPIGSVQLEFPNLDWENIAHLVVRYWSVFMRDNDLYAVEETRIKTGN